MTSPVNPSRFLRHRLPWLIVAMQLAWWSYGTWPITPVEGDEQGVIFGVEGLVHDDPARTQLRYSYGIQPGVYPVLAALVRVSGSPAEAVYGVATITGALFFAVTAVLLLRQVIPWPVGWLGVALLYCQEVTTAACYMNTSALAGGFVLLGLALASRRERLAWLWSGLALAFGGWLRADSLLVAPACLALLYWRHRDWRLAAVRTALVAAVALAAFAGLYFLSGTSVIAGVGEFEQRGFFFSSLRVLLESPFQVLSPGLALAAVLGLGWLAVRREWPMVFLVAAGCMPTLLAQGSAFTTAKYLYYLVPFALCPALWAIDRIQTSVRALPPPRASLGLAVLTALVLADNLIGLRTLTEEKRLFATPTVASLAGFDVGSRTFKLVVGPGELIWNVDAFRVRTGQLFAPACWHAEKTHMRSNLAMVASWLQHDRAITLFWGGWLPLQMSMRQMFAAGFRPDPVPAGGDKLAPVTWSRAGQVVYLSFLGYPGSPYQSAGAPPASATGAATYFIGDGGRQVPAELRDDARWHLVSTRAEGLITLFQRR